MAIFDIALTAQDCRKWDLVGLVEKYREGISQYSVVATMDTGSIIKIGAGIDASLVSRGLEGGYLQIARLVDSGRLGMVIFLHDPTLNLSDPGVMELLTACNVRNIPFANNLITAEFILHRFLEKGMATYWRCPVARPEHQFVRV